MNNDSPLFIALYLDEDVDVLLAALVRARGFDVETTQEAKRVGESDVSQLAYATGVERALLTHNRTDFEQLAQHYFAMNKTHLTASSSRSAARLAT